MSKNINHIQHIKSNVVVDNLPKLPTAQQLVDGEIAINYAKDVETMSIRNASGEIVTFSADNYYAKKFLGDSISENNTVSDVISENNEIITTALNDLDENKADLSALTELRDSIISIIDSDLATKDDVNDTIDERLGDAFSGENSGVTVTQYLQDSELVTSAALNDLNSRKLDASAYTETDLSNYYTKSETDAKIIDAITGVDNILSGYTTNEDLDEKLGDAFTGENSGVTVTQYINDNELVVSAALNDLNDRKMDKSGMTEYATQEWINAQGFLTDSDAVTEDEIDEKLGELFESGASVSQVILDNELVVSAALNDLNSRKLDASAYTPTDLSNYYTKEEVDEQIDSKDLSNYFTKDEIDEKLGDAFTGENSAVTVTEYITNSELVTSAALNDLNSRKLDASAYTPTDLSGYYTKSEVDGMVDEVSSSSTEYVDSILGSGFTSENNVTKVILDNELVVSAALNDLNSRKLDATAYTPTDLSEYYTSAQTDSKISDALSSSDYFDGAEYTSSSHTISFKHGDVVKATIDASDFIKDGMVDSVAIQDVTSGESTVKCLVITFNTDSGKQAVNIPIADFFPPLDDEFSSSASSASTNAVEARAILSYLEEKELVIAAALTDLDSRLQGVAYSADVETLVNGIASDTQGSLLELSGTIDTMKSDIDDSELVISSSLNDLNSRLNALSESVDDIAASQITVDSTFSESASSASSNPVAASALYSYINEIDLGTSSALNDLNSRILSIVSDIESINTRLTNIESRLTALEGNNG